VGKSINALFIFVPNVWKCYAFFPFSCCRPWYCNPCIVHIAQMKNKTTSGFVTSIARPYCHSTLPENRAGPLQSRGAVYHISLYYFRLTVQLGIKAVLRSIHLSVTQSVCSMPVAQLSSF